MLRDCARAGRLLPRVLAGAALIVTASFVPLAQTTSAHVAHKGLLIEPNDATPGFDKVVDTGMSSDMVGFTWTSMSEASLEVRGLSDAKWGDWTQVDGSPSEAPDATSPEHKQQVGAGPVWLGYGISTIEVRLTTGVAHALTLHALDSRPISAGGGVQPAGADTPLPFITPRSRWSADESLRCPDASYASNVTFAVVHHTVNSNSYGPNDSAALVRGIYYFHTQVNGWCDIGYNFLIDRFGQVFEGRYGGINRAVIGAHAGGFNAGSTGVALIGSFDSSPVPTQTYQSLRSLLDWKLAYHHVDPMGATTRTVADSDCNCQRYPVGSTVTIPTITSHRDLDFTDCPGAFMYALLPQLRADVAMDIGRQGPAQWFCQWDTGFNFGPGMASPAARRDDVYVRGGDGQLWQKVQTPTTTSRWSPLGGYLTSDPDVASWGQGRIDIFARGGDGALWHRWYAGGWGPWES
ncbi:MAG TPA: N-acetylmuramoyl-L-alanine amidase, partial [Acidimicrobiales bacterium]|nr:N-acetylmuramoyl-L-alanine amidase [Acidimicrobiales bacterium]